MSYWLRSLTYICAFLILLSYCTSAFASTLKKTVYLYTYHKKPPFIVDLPERTGLYYDFAELLSKRSEHYRFITTYLPRKRLDLLIENNRLDGVVLGATPVWFGDKAQTKFLWLPPFFADADEFVSLKSTPFEFTGDPSLQNKTLAGVSGYYYFGVNNAINQGQLKRLDTVGEYEVLTLIEKGRADMGIVSQSVFKYLKKHAQIEDIYHFSNRQHEAFDRSAFTTLGNTDVHQEMLQLISEVLEDGSWQDMVADYQELEFTKTQNK